ncbi:hypothetical protein STEG23_028222, partial [Scotinomys teguina]
MCQHTGEEKKNNINKEWPKLLQYDERHEPAYQTLSRKTVFELKPLNSRSGLSLTAKDTACSFGPH